MYKATITNNSVPREVVGATGLRTLAPSPLFENKIVKRKVHMVQLVNGSQS